MPCWHGWHDCGRWYGPPYDPGWSGPSDWYEEPVWSGRRRHRRDRRPDPAEVAEDLAARIEDLREELSRTEAELADLRDLEKAGTGA